MGVTKRGVRRSAQVEPWELALVKKVAQTFRTDEREELEAELASKLAALKQSTPKDIRDWQRYVAKFLYNKASNWVRDYRARTRRHVSIAAPTEEQRTTDCIVEDFLPGQEWNEDLRVMLAQVWAELDPELRHLWAILVEEEGNRVAAARTLGKHRNTVRLWIRTIREVLERHGIEGSDW